MDLRKRLFRRPVTTLFWVFLLTAMALLFVVGYALHRSSANLANVLDSHHTTIAVRTDQGLTSTPIEGGASWESTPHSLSHEDVAFLEGLPSVEGVFFHSLTGGYSPSFHPLLGVKATPWGPMDTGYYVNETYDDVLAVVEITAIYKEEVMGSYDLSALGMGAEEPDTSIEAEAKILDLVRGNADYLNSSDEFVNLSVTALGEDAADYLTVGKQYLVLGVYSPEDIGSTNTSYVHPWIHCRSSVLLQQDQLRYVNSMSSAMDDFTTITAVTMGSVFLAELDGSVEAFLSDPLNREWADIADSLNTAQHSVPLIGTDCLESMYSFVSNEAIITQGRSFTAEEYQAGAKVCLISEGLADASSLELGDTVAVSQFLCHDFLDRSFSGNQSTSTGGRNVDGMLNNPTAGNIDPSTVLVTNDEEFTIIGLYRLQDAWADSSYSFTPNTVFLPKKAQIEGGFGGVEELITITDADGFSFECSNENGAHGIYLSVKLRNGMSNSFLRALEGTNYMSTFLTLDQGYGSIQESVDSISESARDLFQIAFIGWLLILSLYVLLYQGLQRKNIGAMRSLGAGTVCARRYLFFSGIVLAAVGILVGTAIGVFLMDSVQDKLLLTPLTEASQNDHSGGLALSQEELAQMLRSSGLSNMQYFLLGLSQLSIIGLVLWIHAALLSRKNPRKLLRL